MIPNPFPPHLAETYKDVQVWLGLLLLTMAVLGIWTSLRAWRRLRSWREYSRPHAAAYPEFSAITLGHVIRESIRVVASLLVLGAVIWQYDEAPLLVGFYVVTSITDQATRSLWLELTLQRLTKEEQ